MRRSAPWTWFAVSALVAGCGGAASAPDAAGSPAHGAAGDGASPAAGRSGGGASGSTSGAPSAGSSGASSGGAGSSSTPDGGKPVQGDAPAGYCPGVEIAPTGRDCSDRDRGSCSRCTPNFDVPLPLPVCGPFGGATPCQVDADCSRLGSRCDPTHPYRDGQGCRPRGCDEGVTCQAGAVCDPDDRWANWFGQLLQLPDPPLLVPGCRLRRCDEADGTACLPGQTCDPAVEASASGCRALRCGQDEPCPTGYRCREEPPGCIRLQCAEPGALPCEPGKRCDSSRRPEGECVAIHCAQPDGIECPPGNVCEADALGDGCRSIPCNEPGALPCTPGRRCLNVFQSAWACAECVADADCGCGSCVEQRCYNRPGYCADPCP